METFLLIMAALPLVILVAASVYAWFRLLGLRAIFIVIFLVWAVWGISYMSDRSQTNPAQTEATQ